MRKIEIGRNVVEIYDSIDEMPIVRYHRFNKYLLIDSGLGSSIEDITQHLGNIARVVKGDPDRAIKEIENLRQGLFLMSEEISPKHLAFVPLIHSINGKPLTDLSEDGIRATIKHLGQAKTGFLNGLLESVKKKNRRGV